MDRYLIAAATKGCCTENLLALMKILFAEGRIFDHTELERKKI